MSASESQQCYRLAESMREQWADIMLHALKENGHVYLTDDEYYRLKGDLMSLLIGRIKV